MDLLISDEDREFVREVRQFFASDYPPEILARVRKGVALTRSDHVSSQQALNSRGWLGIGWPTRHGGTGWTPVRRYWFEQELERAGAPSIIPMAVIYIGPIICAFGTLEQQRRWLPNILQSRAMWAQGYSEPGAGSDLASLRMSATRDGDEFILQGSKIWTSGAHWADWIFCLVRSANTERKQDGISMICVDMNSPGVSVRPIISIDGTHELNQVNFEQVRVPLESLIGEEGRGWHYANVLLSAERVSYAHIGRKKADLAALLAMAASVPSGSGATMAEDRSFTTKLARAQMALAALEILVLRVLTGDATAASVSALKIICTQQAQDITSLWLDLAGRDRIALIDRAATGWEAQAPGIAPFAVPRTASYHFERAQTIYGGSTEVQKTIVWRVLSRTNTIQT